MSADDLAHALALRLPDHAVDRSGIGSPDRPSCRAVRRQITAFLPEFVGAEIDEIRSRWDPEMAALISAHVTVVHDAPDRSPLDRVRGCSSLRIRLTGARCWGTPDGGVYLGVDDGRGDLASVRETLRAMEAPGVEYEPHVTLLHPRTVSALRLREAWAELAHWTVDCDVVLDRISLVELVDAHWSVIDEVVLEPR